MANKKLDSYLKLSKVFKNKGFQLYLAGSTVSHFLLHIDLGNMYLATDATPNQLLSFLKGADSSRQDEGIIKYHYDGINFTISTLRDVTSLFGFKLSSKIKYTNNPKKDYQRQDFTINAMYLDSYFVVYDYCNGKEDLKNKKIRFVDNASQRIKKDPLLIVEAIRLALTLGFSFDKKTEEALKKNTHLLKSVEKAILIETIKNIIGVDESIKNKLFADFAIHQFIDVIE